VFIIDDDWLLGCLSVPVCRNGQFYLMILLCFFLFFYSPLFLQNRTAHQDQNWGKDTLYLEGIKAKFQRDSLRGFGRKGHLYLENGNAIAFIY